MLAVTDTQIIPRGGVTGWNMTLNGTFIQAFSYTSLLNQTLAEADRQGIAVPLDREQWFQDQLCRARPDLDCGVAAPITTETRKLSVGDALRFLRVVKEWLWSSGAQLVSQAEADRRSEICAGCPYNVEVTGCSICKGIAGKIFEVRGNHTTRFEKQLKGCAVCGCVNSASVHLPLEVLAKGVTTEMKFPEWCWKVSLGAS
jgi:hypothetical protein